jgi:hypothetical protein
MNAIRFPTPVPTDPYAALHTSLIEIHHALVGSLRAVEAAAASANLGILGQQVLAAGGFLLGHHEAESTVLFPILRRAGKLRSTDIAVLDRCDREHHVIHSLCERLIASGSAAHPSASEIATLSRELLAAFTAHIGEEEKGLAPDRLRTMMDVDDLAVLAREQAAFQARHQR